MEPVERAIRHRLLLLLLTLAAALLVVWSVPACRPYALTLLRLLAVAAVAFGSAAWLSRRGVFCRLSGAPRRHGPGCEEQAGAGTEDPSTEAPGGAT